MSLYAKNHTNAKIITKVSRDRYINMADMLGLDSIISPKNLTTSIILSYVRSLNNTKGSSIESLYKLVDNKVEAIEFFVKEPINNLTNIPIRDIQLKKDILICAIVRKRKTIIPNGDDQIEVGDSIVIATKDYSFSDLKDILN